MSRVSPRTILLLPAMLAAVASLALTACSSSSTSAAGSPQPSAPSSSGQSTAPSAGAVPRFKHVVVVIFENHGYSQVIGSPDAPFFSTLAAHGASFTAAAAVSHPSQPNYLALFSGSTQGITNDSCPHTFATPNLAAGLIGAGLTFGGYVDSLPSAGASVCTSGNYARKHVPWADFSNVPASVTRSFSTFPQAAGGDFQALPTVSFVIPDLCNDMHNCPVSTGNAWLSAHLSAYAAWARSHDSLLIVTFDENEGGAGNVIPLIFYGANVKPGSYAGQVSHYSVLRTLEDAYGLPHDGAAASAAPITDCWTAGGS